jgi:hypothetical protein
MGGEKVEPCSEIEQDQRENRRWRLRIADEILHPGGQLGGSRDGEREASRERRFPRANAAARVVSRGEPSEEDGWRRCGGGGSGAVVRGKRRRCGEAWFGALEGSSRPGGWLVGRPAVAWWTDGGTNRGRPLAGRIQFFHQPVSAFLPSFSIAIAFSISIAILP